MPLETQQVDATLLVEQPDTSMLPLKADAARALTVSDTDTRTTLTAILAELQQKLEAGGVVQLASTTLDALLGIARSTEVDNFPGDYPDAATAGLLANLLTELQQKLEPGGQVALDAATLAALESITAKIQWDGLDVGETHRLPVDVGDTINIDNVSVNFDSLVSTLNSPTVPLGANATYTGTWEDVKDYASIAVAVHTDASTTPTGASIEFSNDGVNVIRRYQGMIVGGIQSYFELAPEARYMRVVMVNGPVAQTFIRCSVILRFNPPGLIQAPLASPSTDLDIGGMTRAHLLGRNVEGAVFGVAPWVGLRVDPDGQLYVKATDLDLRALSLDMDNVRQTQRPMSSYVATQAAGDGPVTAANVTAPTRIRLLRLDGGSKPSNPADTFCTVTIALGATVVFVKELQVGEPIGGQVCLEGAAGEDLIVTVTGTGSVQLNLRYETF